MKVLEQLCHNAVVEHRLLSFNDYFQKLEYPRRNSKFCSIKHRQCHEPIGGEQVRDFFGYSAENRSKFSSVIGY